MCSLASRNCLYLELLHDSDAVFSPYLLIHVSPNSRITDFKKDILTVKCLRLKIWKKGLCGSRMLAQYPVKSAAVTDNSTYR